MSKATGRRWRIWLNAILAAGCGLGCRGILGHQTTPEDPLFAKRKPVESKAVTAAPVAIAFVEPPMPADAKTALASAKDSKDTDTAKIPPKSGNVRGILTSQPTTRKTDDRKRHRENPPPEAPADDGPILPPAQR